MKKAATPRNVLCAVTAVITGAMVLLLPSLTPISNIIDKEQLRCQDSVAEESAGVSSWANDPAVENDDAGSGDPAAAMAYIRSAPRLLGPVAAINIGGVPHPAVSTTIVQIAPKQGPPTSSLVA